MARLATTICLLMLLAAGTVAPAAHAAPSHKRLPRAWAAQNHLGPQGGDRDTDRDGLSNWGEYRSGTDPRKRDSDRNGVLDALEDPDHDRLVNVDELAAGTNPRSRDSDRDGLPDGREDRDADGLRNALERTTGHDVSLRDSDADGVLDGADNAGTVTAVSATGAVTIRLAVGGTVSATLSADSWIDCTATAPAPAAAGVATRSTDPAAGGSSGSTGSSGSSDPAGSGDPTDSTPPADDPGATDPADAAPVPVDDDPARLASFMQVPDGGDDPSVDDGTGPPDLGACAATLRVGAIVHKATIEAGAALTDLQLMKG